ncbi:DUF86 domain-containing protein [Candidatus Deferrimicrobium sp.]|uniref:HepT-like ribonuclease domain-containing protein n=1 Tax=Candidatus Deferrimicrobium sp. TaxID=3060586 RepID=UPI00271FD3CE|nr:HepT-like ribonuclease domain-containing protein [Candidatus Deferrimicrobium sp.]MDO8738310.1 DUF86 domain-containing protein [Candidatus Deferrimicrobium sp.]
MRDDDAIRIRHMLDAAREAIGFASGRTSEDLTHDRMLLLSLVKCVEILGEAASKVTDATRESLPEIPWRDIISMRNRLIHGYFDIDTTIVWKTVALELPPLEHALEKVLR